MYSIFFDGSFLSRSDQKRIIYFFQGDRGIFIMKDTNVYIPIKELIFDEFLHEIYLFYKLAIISDNR